MFYPKDYLQYKFLLKLALFKELPKVGGGGWDN